MQESTKVALTNYVKAVAKQNGVDDATSKFTATPAATQKLIGKLRESNWFLSKINVVMVKNQIGEALGLSVGGMIASRTDTSGDGTRKPKSVVGLSPMPYVCMKTDFDTAIRYATLDAWAHLPNFNRMAAKHTREQCDANKITVGWYGKSAQSTTDSKLNPNGEDVNKGWFQALRDHNPTAMLVEGETAGKIRIGDKSGDFLNLDLAVLNVKSLLGDVFANASDLIAIIGTDLLAYDKAKFYEQNGNTPSEKARIQEKQVIGTYGGLPAVSVPGFPPTGIFVTSYSNLSIYIQEGSVRRSVGKKNDEKDQVENFESMNMAYVIEDLGKAAALEFGNVELYMNNGWV